MLIIFLLIFTITQLDAEVLKKGALITGYFEKKDIIAVTDSFNVTCDPVEEGKYRISFSLKIGIHDKVINGKNFEVKQNDKILDENGKEIGIALCDFGLQDPRKTGNYIRGFVDGFVKEEFVDSTSDIDKHFEKLIQSKTLSFFDFKTHLQNFKYYRWQSTSDFKTYITYGACAMCVPIIRILPVFYNDTLFCVIDHHQLKNLVEYPHKPLREFRVTYFSNNKKIRKTFESIYFQIILRGD